MGWFCQKFNSFSSVQQLDQSNEFETLKYLQGPTLASAETEQNGDPRNLVIVLVNNGKRIDDSMHQQTNVVNDHRLSVDVGRSNKKIKL